MLTEQQLLSELNDTPRAATLLALADWYEERGDPRAEAYRWAVAWERQPGKSTHSFRPTIFYWYSYGGEWNPPIYSPTAIPRVVIGGDSFKPWTLSGSASSAWTTFASAFVLAVESGWTPPEKPKPRKCRHFLGKSKWQAEFDTTGRSRVRTSYQSSTAKS